MCLSKPTIPMSSRGTFAFEHQPGWKTKDGVVSFDSMSNKELKSLYRYCQVQEMKAMNKASLFADKQSEIQIIAKERGLALKSVNAEYFRDTVITNSGS